MRIFHHYNERGPEDNSDAKEAQLCSRAKENQRHRKEKDLRSSQTGNGRAKHWDFNYALGQALPAHICDVSTWLSGGGSQVQGQCEWHNKIEIAACLPLVLLQSLISAFKRLLEGCHSHASSRVLFLPTTKPQLIEEGAKKNLREIPTMWPPCPVISRERIKISWFRCSLAFAIQSFYPGSVTQSKGRK